MTPAVSVVVVNFNAGSHLTACLSSLTRNIAATWEAVVIDNASSDGSVDQVAGLDSRIRLLCNAENLGFGRGVNQGVAATTGVAILILNPDARVTNGAVDRLLDELAAHPDCAVVGPGIVNDDGTFQGSARGDPDMVTGFFGRTTLLTRLFPTSGVAQRNVMTPDALAGRAGGGSVVVDWVSGACMLVRRDVFGRVRGFDERFFLYWEDADLCRRVRTAGFTTRYCPSARVEHSVGQSSRSARGLALRAFHESAYLYYRIHVAPSAWNPLRWLAWLLLQSRYVLKRAMIR